MYKSGFGIFIMYAVCVIIALSIGGGAIYKCSKVEEMKKELISRGANPKHIVCDCSECKELTEKEFIDFNRKRNKNNSGGFPRHVIDHGAGIGIP